MFSKIPVRTICGIRIFPLAKTTALGGVAAGIMKAADAAIVAGIMSSNGLSPAAVAMAARTGSNTAVVAVFEVTSVNKLKARATTPMMTQSELPSINGAKAEPMAASKPET